MKTRNVLTLLSLIFCAGHLFATDRVVQQAGPVGTYASITAAITASVDGDNIVINNRTDGLPWMENLTINKSLTFVSAVDNIQWWMEGTITINAAEGRVITIVGMRNSSATGSITKNATIPVNRTVLNMLYCDIASDIILVSGINFYLGSSKVAGNVSFSYGKIYGNDLRMLTCSADAASSEDVNQIIGNRIGYTFTPSVSAYYHNNNTQYLYFSNNYVRSSSGSGANIGSMKAGVTTNRIINSTLCSGYTSNSNNNYAGLKMDQTTGTLSIENCSMGGAYINSSNASHGVYVATSGSAVTTFTYNMYFNHLASGTTLSTSLNNFVSSSAITSNINADGGFVSGTSHVDAGNPSNASLDLDLTRNDCGVFGGSYSMANYIPLMSNVESSRVNYMSTPRIVNQGGTVNVQVTGYDK